MAGLDSARAGPVVAAAAVLATVVFVAAAAPVATAGQEVVVGRPDVSMFAPDNRLSPGVTTLAVYVSNAGDLDRGGPVAFEDRVTTARNVTVRVATEEFNAALADAVDVRTGTVPVGTVPPGVAGPVTFALYVDPGLPPGTYRLPVEVTYEYSPLVRYSDGGDPVYVDRERTVVETVPVVVGPRPELSVRLVGNQSVVAGGTGRVRVAVTNTGTEAAVDVALTFRTDNASVFFGAPPDETGRVQRYLRRVPPGGTRRVRLAVSVPAGTPPGQYLVTATASYATPSGGNRTQTGLVFGLPVRQQRAAVADADAVISPWRRIDVRFVTRVRRDAASGE